MYSSDTSFFKIGPVINEEKQSQKDRLNVNRGVLFKARQLFFKHSE